jgi:hypothetical protein
MATKLQPKKFKYINEALDWATEVKNVDELRERVRAISTGNSILMRFLAWGVGYEQGPYNLPDGKTPIKNEGLPDGIADTTITMEFRRILTLLPNGSAAKIPQWRREEIWMQICQGCHPNETNLLDAVKDQNILAVYPALADVLESFLGGWKKPEVKKKRVSKKPETISDE